MYNDIDFLFFFMDKVKYFYLVIIKVYFILIKFEYQLYFFLFFSKDVQ